MKIFRPIFFGIVILLSNSVIEADSSLVINYSNGRVQFIPSADIKNLEFLPDIHFISSSSLNIISSMANDETYVSEGTYTYIFNSEENSKPTGTILSPDLMIDDENLSFTVKDMNYQATEEEIFFGNLQGSIEDTDLQLKEANFLILKYCEEEDKSYGYYINNTKCGEYTYTLNYYKPWETIASYNLDDKYQVNTFQKDSFFKGITKTSYQRDNRKEEVDMDFTTYRVMLKKELNSSGYTADIIIYDVKFTGSPAEPIKKVVLLTDLRVEFGNNNLTIRGENLVPSFYEGDNFTPYSNFMIENFIFKSFYEFNTQAVIDYQISNFNIHFEGSYINSQFYLNN